MEENGLKYSVHYNLAYKWHTYGTLIDYNSKI